MTLALTSPTYDVTAVRAQFPILARQVNGKPLAYLDNAASAHKPDAVIDAMAAFMRTSYANVHRGLHTLANEATEAFEDARTVAASFLGALSPDQIVFTRGATEALNLVANGLAPEFAPGDEVVLSVMEHHANIVPWHFLRVERGVVLRWVGLTEDGGLDMAALADAIGPRTRVVALPHMSNVLGTVVDIPAVVALARSVGAVVVIDGCQGAVHAPVDVASLGVDFYAASGHKLYGPTGIGLLYGRAEALERLRPLQGGGEMIETVTQDHVTYAAPPQRFEAGTPAIVEAVGLAAALRWLMAHDRPALYAHEAALSARLERELSLQNGVRLHGRAPGKGAIVTFSVEGAHPHDLAQLLDRYGVAIRAGHHCAQPLMRHLGVSATARASLAAYSTDAEVDQFLEALTRARRMLS
jgi:cysteine desulfurase/selenocysteine lyase